MHHFVLHRVRDMRMALAARRTSFHWHPERRCYTYGPTRIVNEDNAETQLELRIAGEIGTADAEGATAPETLRPQDRDAHETLERGA